MKNIFAFISMFTLVNAATAQINRVYNPSFEQISQCPNYNWQAYYADGWSGLDTSYFGAGGNCNPYLYNTCSTTYGLPLPNNSFFFQYPRSGNSLFTYENFVYDSTINFEFRSFLHGKVYNLGVAKIYCAKFYVVKTNTSMYASNKQSIYFDDGGLCSAGSCGTPKPWINPQISNQIIISDTLNWQKIEGVFTSMGNEKFINIGNFGSHSQTQRMQVNNNMNFQESHYLIDDISVIDISTPAFAGTDALIANGDSIYLGRPNEIGPECRWWANGAVVDSSLGFWAKPTQPTQYVLEQKICGNVKYDTVLVNVSGHVNTAPNIVRHDAISIVPNPNNGSFSIVCSNFNNETIAYQILDVSGKIISSGTTVFNEGKSQLTLDLAKGLYFIKVQNNGVFSNHKLLIAK